MTLTESLAMLPAASVSGIYLAHPDARYFAVGPVGSRPGRRLRARQGWKLAESNAPGAESRLRPRSAAEPAGT